MAAAQKRLRGLIRQRRYRRSCFKKNALAKRVRQNSWCACEVELRAQPGEQLRLAVAEEGEAEKKAHRKQRFWLHDILKK